MEFELPRSYSHLADCDWVRRQHPLVFTSRLDDGRNGVDERKRKVDDCDGPNAIDGIAFSSTRSVKRHCPLPDGDLGDDIPDEDGVCPMELEEVEDEEFDETVREFFKWRLRRMVMRRRRRCGY